VNLIVDDFTSTHLFSSRHNVGTVIDYSRRRLPLDSLECRNTILSHNNEESIVLAVKE